MNKSRPIFYPDDGKTKIYYDQISDDFESASLSNNFERMKYIKENFNERALQYHSTYYECLLKKKFRSAFWIFSNFLVGIDEYFVKDEFVKYLRKYDLIAFKEMYGRYHDNSPKIDYGNLIL